MSTSALILLLILFGGLAFLFGVMRARSTSGGEPRSLHSRQGYYGSYLMLWTVLPAFLLALSWAALSPTVISHLTAQQLQAQKPASVTTNEALLMGVVSTIADSLPELSEDELARLHEGSETAKQILSQKGVVLAAPPERYLIDAAFEMARLRRISRIIATTLAGALLIGGFAYGTWRIRPELRARNVVERIMLAGLWAASTVAILTTVGIVLSVLFQSLDFFSRVPPADFFFGTVWDPRFSSVGRELSGAEGQFGLIPLLWGTLFISAVALMVAVPIGLFSAIYMSEYAGNRVRATAKPLIEVLAGIPTIVYGFFALVTFGPFLRDAGAAVGLEISATSVLTAGVVMGVMIIPFVSSLSDDVINAVPQSLREGSYGLGATQSETIKKVILPAALPGIMGAILLAGSRAVGETMIVVLAAGIAANLTINPFESVTTITVKIVSQLTGDLEFNSPQTLVAFALGLTLFVITLGLNIYALYIVRKYREQYE